MAELTTDQTLHDVACTVCACVCDDLTVTIRNDRIVDYRPFCSRIGNWFEQQNSKPFPPALRAAVECPLSVAVEQAAGLLRTARNPLFYGLSQSSTEGQRAAVALADYLGATIDTTASQGHAPSILALQHVGESTCSLGEIRNRSDLVIYWGSDPVRSHPRHLERYAGFPTADGPRDRRMIVVDSQRTATADVADQFLQLQPQHDFEALWALRALLRGIEPRSQSSTGLPLEQLRDLIEQMRTCHSGVIFFGYGLAQQPLAFHSVSALLQLVTDLNQHTRFYARRMRMAGDVSGADSVLCWQTGYPFSVNLAQGFPRYNPDDYSAIEVLTRHETDLAVLIGASRLDSLPTEALRHLQRIPTILLDHPLSQAPFEPTIRITTSVYGIHRHGTAYRMDEIPIPLRPLLPSSYPSDGEVLKSIHQLLC